MKSVLFIFAIAFALPHIILCLNWPDQSLGRKLYDESSPLECPVCSSSANKSREHIFDKIVGRVDQLFDEGTLFTKLKSNRVGSVLNGISKNNIDIEKIIPILSNATSQFTLLAESFRNETYGRTDSELNEQIYESTINNIISVSTFMNSMVDHMNGQTTMNVKSVSCSILVLLDYIREIVTLNMATIDDLTTNPPDLNIFLQKTQALSNMDKSYCVQEYRYYQESYKASKQERTTPFIFTNVTDQGILCDIISLPFVLYIRLTVAIFRFFAYVVVMDIGFISVLSCIPATFFFFKIVVLGVLFQSISTVLGRFSCNILEQLADDAITSFGKMVYDTLEENATTVTKEDFNCQMDAFTCNTETLLNMIT